MADGGNPMNQARELIFGAGNLEYQVEQFIKSGGQSVNILLSGKTGVGKSHLTNALIGEELAEEGEAIDPQTDEVSKLKKEDVFFGHTNVTTPFNNMRTLRTT